jgi:hypothetical protein
MKSCICFSCCHKHLQGVLKRMTCVSWEGGTACFQTRHWKSGSHPVSHVIGCTIQTGILTENSRECIKSGCCVFRALLLLQLCLTMPCQALQRTDRKSDTGIGKPQQSEDDESALVALAGEAKERKLGNCVIRWECLRPYSPVQHKRLCNRELR